MLARVVALISVLLTSCAFAQDAPQAAGPAGNEHPERNIVMRSGSAMSPFGPPMPDAAMDAAVKAAFAGMVDLGPLRDLAVLHNGRVKILDTLARETVSTLAGRSTFQDFIHHGETDIEKVNHDPLFTLLDMMIDPAFYASEPLIHIEYLPLREAYLASAFPDDSEKRLRWKKVTRVSPAMIEAFSGRIFDAYGDSPAYRRGISRAERANELFLFGVNNLLVIAPESKTDSWHHLAEAPAGSPVLAAAAELGRCLGEVMP
ncbi:MAG: hypothetical protein K8E66_00460, partial [Phycisphaerales bacterium]|nr:hypothetical protein [Phycisphaerales bacterium]